MYSTNKPHVHKDVIIAWAKGAEIQTEFAGEWTACLNPSFSVDLKYRVKPDEDLYFAVIEDLSNHNLLVLLEVVAPKFELPLSIEAIHKLWHLAKLKYNLTISTCRILIEWTPV